MGHRDSYGASALYQDGKCGDETALESESGSHGSVALESDAGGRENSSETRLEEEYNVTVKVDSEIDSDEASSLSDDTLEEEVVVPEMEVTVAVIVPETQETVVDLLPHEVANPHPNRA
jgi:hypothetical protein